MMTNSPMRIGLLLYTDCMPTGHFAVSDLLYAANRRAGRQVFETVFIAEQPESVSCAHGHCITPESTLLHDPVDAVIIPPCWAESVQEIEHVLAINRPLLAALNQLNENVLIMGYCSGACFVAATGRLNGEPATVTWWLTDLARKMFPKVLWNVEQECIAGKGVITAANGHSYQMIAKELMDKYVAKNTYFEMTKMMARPIPDRAHQAFEAMDLAQQGDEFMRHLFLLAQALPASEVTVRKLARDLGMTERTLARRVNAATGVPIASYLRRIKLHQVSERLILTNTPASAISASLGFSTESTMRRMFKDVTGMTPLEYRNVYKRSAVATQASQ